MYVPLQESGRLTTEYSFTCLELRIASEWGDLGWLRFPGLKGSEPTCRSFVTLQLGGFIPDHGLLVPPGKQSVLAGLRPLHQRVG